MHHAPLAFIGLLFAIGFWGKADAQAVPPHPPGTICFTPALWCWAQPPGPSGTACTCPSPSGYLRGVRG